MIKGISITSQEIVEYQRYLRGFLSEHVSEADLSSGSFIDDIVVKSMAYVLALFDKESKNIKSRLSVNDVSLSEDMTSTQILDDIASNFFLYRKEGSLSRGTVRVVVSSKETPINILPLTRFTKSLGVNFAYEGGIDGDTGLTIGVDDFIEETLNSSFTGNYYFDVPVVGEVEVIGSELAPGDFISVSPSIKNLVRVHNVNPFTLAESQETNFEFSNRIKTALTNRGMNSSSGIENYLLDTIPNLKKVKAVGASNPLMRRDILKLPNSLTQTSFKTLGKCNVYSSLGYRVETKSLSVTLPSYAEGSSATLVETSIQPTLQRVAAVIALPDSHSLVSNILDNDGNLLHTLVDNYKVMSTSMWVGDKIHTEFTYIDPQDTNLVNSSGHLYCRTPSENLGIKLPSNLVPSTGGDHSIPTVKVLLCNTPGAVDTEISLESNDVPGLDTLSYCYTVKYLKLSIKYYLSSSAPGDLPESFIKSDLCRYINNFSYTNTDISVQDIYSYFTSEYSTYVSGIDISDSSLEMSTFLPNGVSIYFSVLSSTSFSSSSTRPYYLSEVGGQVSKVFDFLPPEYLLNLQVGDDTSLVHIEPDNITLVRA